MSEGKSSGPGPESETAAGTSRGHNDSAETVAGPSPRLNLADAKATTSVPVRADTIRVVDRGDGGTLVIADREDGSRILVATMTLRPAAPARVRRVWWDRVLSVTLGECPRCGAVRGIDGTDGQTIAGTIWHRDDCPVADEGALVRHATRESVKFLRAVVTYG